MEKKYKRTVNLVAVLMIIQFCLWLAGSFVYGIVSSFLAVKFDRASAEAAEELVFAFIYLVAFGVPIFLGKRFVSNGESAGFNKPSGAYVLPMLFASLGVIFASAILNNLVTAPFDSVGLDVYTPDTSMTVTPLNFLVHLLSLVIIPAFLEELLFRGVILSALLPYGRVGAILTSSLLFAMMHQNPKQFIYAFAAGTIMGYFVSETKSLRISVIIHGVNNFISLVNMTIMNACDERTLNAYLLSLYFSVFTLACVSIPVLIGSKESRDEALCAKTLTISNFFTPAMIIYFVISVLYFIYMVIL